LFVTSVIALHHFNRRRLIFISHLEDSKSGLTTNQYFWLISMTITNLTWNTIATIFNLYINVSGGLRPWTSWNDVHSHWDHTDIRSQNTMPPGAHRIMMLLWWSVPVSSFILFICQYGFGQEIKEEYVRGWIRLKKTIFCGRHLEDRETISTSHSLRRP
jgi:pheromone a factor receptor